MAGKINYFVTYSDFNELFSGYSRGFAWQIGCTLGSGKLRWGALPLGMTGAISSKPSLYPSCRAHCTEIAILTLV